MTDDETFLLSQIDPEDISDVLEVIERSFGFKFQKDELKDVKTFGELCDIITIKVPGIDAYDCTTQQAFYRVRNAIAETIRSDKSTIKPDTHLDLLMPREGRRKMVADIDKNLGLKTKMLRPKVLVANGLVVAIIISFPALFIIWKIALPVFLLSILFSKLSERYGNELDVETVGELAAKIARNNYQQARRHNETVNRNEIAAKVRELFEYHLGLEASSLSRAATFD